MCELVLALVSGVLLPRTGLSGKMNVFDGCNRGSAGSETASFSLQNNSDNTFTEIRSTYSHTWTLCLCVRVWEFVCGFLVSYLALCLSVHESVKVRENTDYVCQTEGLSLYFEVGGPPVKDSGMI